MLVLLLASFAAAVAVSVQHNDNIRLINGYPSFKSFKYSVGGFDIVAEEGDVAVTAGATDGKTIFLANVGTGWGNAEHPSTQLCLSFLREKMVSGGSSRVLDYGCGSGILSLFAARLGSAYTKGVDIDEDSIDAARNNVKINGLEAVCEICHTREVYSGDSTEQLFDITVANILPGVLSRLAQPIIGLTRPRGSICLSGMRPDQLDAIRAIYSPFMEQGSEVVRHQSSELYGDWCSYACNVRDMPSKERRALFERLLDEGVGY